MRSEKTDWRSEEADLRSKKADMRFGRGGPDRPTNRRANLGL